MVYTTKNDSLRKENYRPVNILTSLSKYMRRSWITSCQSWKPGSFQIFFQHSGQDTQYVLMNLMEKWKSALDTHKSFCTIIMDLYNVFHCIPHDVWLAKLKAYVIEDQVFVTFFINYFCWFFEEELLANYADDSNRSVIQDECMIWKLC